LRRCAYSPHPEKRHRSSPRVLAPFRYATPFYGVSCVKCVGGDILRAYSAIPIVVAEARRIAPDQLVG
jgi:hypothetical protein